MPLFTTIYCATKPQDNIKAVAHTLQATIAMALRKGYSVRSITPHVGIVDGVSCTIGYTIFVSRPTPEENTQSDPLQMVIAI